MQTYAFPAFLEVGDEGGLVVTFPDVPEAITDGRSRAEALAHGADALGLALLMYLREGRALPKARAAEGPLVTVSVEADVAAKLAVIEAFTASGLSQSELGRRLGFDVKNVRRVLDPMHPTKLSTLRPVLEALGRRLVIGWEPIASAA